jgi:hypothetical protein
MPEETVYIDLRLYQVLEAHLTDAFLEFDDRKVCRVKLSSPLYEFLSVGVHGTWNSMTTVENIAITLNNP